MRLLLVRPVSPNERFGLGPFFRVEPLGLEYLGRALLEQGHDVRIADSQVRAFAPAPAPELPTAHVGIACTHTVDVPAALGVAREVRRWAPGVFTRRGHAASSFPDLLVLPEVDAIAIGDGELSVPDLCRALARGSLPTTLPGLWLRGASGWDAATPPVAQDRVNLDQVPLPARELIATQQSHYLCVHKMPLWAVETSRGCPYRCAFCSIWKHHGRTLRLRGIGNVAEDLEQVGHNVFVVDDSFFAGAERAQSRARAGARPPRHQEGLDAGAGAARHGHEACRPARRVATGRAPVRPVFRLRVTHQPGPPEPRQADDRQRAGRGRPGGQELRLRRHRQLRGGPRLGEADFHALWDLVDSMGLERSGYTVLTPLPGPPFRPNARARIHERDWSRYDMHHILWEPRLGRRRFFEPRRTWRKNVLNPTHSRQKWLRWLRGLTFAQARQLARVVYRTRRMLDVDAYLAETFPLQVPAAMGDAPTLGAGHPEACPLVRAPAASRAPAAREPDRIASKTL